VNNKQQTTMDIVAEYMEYIECWVVTRVLLSVCFLCFRSVCVASSQSVLFGLSLFPISPFVDPLNLPSSLFVFNMSRR
jgi:hypothetical protein